MKTMKKWKTNQIKWTNKRKRSNHSENKIQTLKKSQRKGKNNRWKYGVQAILS